MTGRLGVCPDCGMPRHRRRVPGAGWAWSPCGPCELLATYRGGQ